MVLEDLPASEGLLFNSRCIFPKGKIGFISETIECHLKIIDQSRVVDVGRPLAFWHQGLTRQKMTGEYAGKMMGVLSIEKRRRDRSRDKLQLISEIHR